MSSTFGELSVTNDVPSHHFLMVLGALNAHLSKVDSERDMIHDGTTTNVPTTMGIC